IGAVIQGSGNDILTLRNSSAALVTKVTQGGSFVHSGGGSQFTQPFNHVYGGSSPIKADAYVLNLISGRGNRRERRRDGQRRRRGDGRGPVRRGHHVRRAHVGLVAGRRLRHRPERQ